jgi:hypothetical protein
MAVPLAVAVPWLAPVATVTLVAVPPVMASAIVLALLPWATLALTAPAVGGARGITELDAADAAPVPMALVAVTLKL